MIVSRIGLILFTSAFGVILQSMFNNDIGLQLFKFVRFIFFRQKSNYIASETPIGFG